MIVREIKEKQFVERESFFCFCLRKIVVRRNDEKKKKYTERNKLNNLKKQLTKQI